MPEVSSEDQFLMHLMGIKEALSQAFVAETGCRPEMLKMIHEVGTSERPETFRFEVKK